MSAQIDIVPERRSQAKGSGTATFGDRYRFSARSANLMCRIARHVADELKMELKNLLAGLLLLACNGLGDPSHEDTVFLRFSARIFLEITCIDTQHKITVYTKVIIFSKTEGIL
jgi:hypothetical protein